MHKFFLRLRFSWVQCNLTFSRFLIGQVFQEVQSLVTSCIDGFNVCIFAYGQTGSGKTYTMEVQPHYIVISYLLAFS